MQVAIGQPQGVAGQGVQRPERLVHQDDPRPGRQRPHHPHPLTLPPGKGVGEAAGVGLRQGRQVEELADPCGDVGGGPPEQARRDGDVLGHGHMRKEADVLEHIAYAAPQRRRVDRVVAPALHQDLAGVRLDQPVDALERRGLAGAGSAHEGHERPLGHFEAHRVHRRRIAAEPAAHPLQGDQRRGGHGPVRAWRGPRRRPRAPCPREASPGRSSRSCRPPKRRRRSRWR